MSDRSVRIKTLEEIRLERVQAESAAYYSYPSPAENNYATTTVLPSAQQEALANDLRNRILKRVTQRNVSKTPAASDFKILSLEEIRKRKQRDSSLDSEDTSNDESSAKVRKIERNTKRKTKAKNKNKSNDISQVNVKTLAEIRAAKESNVECKENNKRHRSPSVESVQSKRVITEKDVSSTQSEMCVSSSSAVTSSRKSRRKLSVLGENGGRTKPKLIRPRIVDDTEGKKENRLDAESTENSQNIEIRLSPKLDTYKEDTNNSNYNNQEGHRIPDIVADCNKSSEIDLSLELTEDTSEKRIRCTSTKSEDSYLLLGDSDLEEENSSAEDILQNIDDILND